MTSPATATIASTGTATPSVLALIVVGPGAAPWLRDCLLALANQSYPRLGVLAVDDDADEGSRELLNRSLGPRRVLRNERSLGPAHAVREALDRPMAKGADFILILEPSAALDRDAVARLVEAAVGIGVEDVGIVGAKIVDKDDPRFAARHRSFLRPLRPPGIGAATGRDRSGAVRSRPRSAVCVVGRDAHRARRVGAGGDVGRTPRSRARGPGPLLAHPGRRVPRADDAARACPRRRHRHGGDVRAARRGRGARFEEDRAAITAMLKNYGILSLAWLVPASLLMGAIRIVYLSLGRRFDEALDVVAAWWWNLAHLPGTVSRRRRIQKARRVRDRDLRPFMESPGLRSPRWFATAERILEEQRAIDEADEGEPIQRRLRDRTASLVGTHPVIVASLLAIVVGAVAVRELLGLDVLAGGALPAFPARAGDLIAELTSAVRSTPLGGPLAPSPAIGALGGALLGGVRRPVDGAEGRPPRRTAAGRDPAVPGGRPTVGPAGAGRRGRGRLRTRSADALVLLRRPARPVARPRRAPGCRGTCRDRVRRGRSLRAVGGGSWRDRRSPSRSASPRSRASRSRSRCSSASAWAWAPPACAGCCSSRSASSAQPCCSSRSSRRCWPTAGAPSTSLVGTTEPERLARLALGPGPGTWTIAAFLPIGAAIGLGLVRGALRGPAVRAAVAAGAGLILSWLAAANYLPPALSNPPAFAARGGGVDGGPDRVRPHLVHRLAATRVVRDAAGLRRCARRRPGGGDLPAMRGRDGGDLGRRLARGTDPARVDGGQRRGERRVPGPVAHGGSRRRPPPTGRRSAAPAGSGPRHDPLRRSPIERVRPSWISAGRSPGPGRTISTRRCTRSWRVPPVTAAPSSLRSASASWSPSSARSRTRPASPSMRRST